MTHSFLLFVIYALAVYRIAKLLIDDEIMVWFRDRVKEWAHVGKVKKGTVTRRDRVRLEVWKLATCFWCLSMWIATGVTLLAYYQGAWFQWVCAALALSGFTGILSEKV